MVGRARMQQPMSGMSQPSVSTMQLVTTSMSPDGQPARMASRSSLRRLPSRCSARTPALTELIADMDAVADAAGEGDGLAALAVLEPVRDDVADELVRVHPLGKLGLDIVARLRSDAAQIGIYRRIDLRLDEIALLDQVGRPAGTRSWS